MLAVQRTRGNVWDDGREMAVADGQLFFAVNAEYNDSCERRLPNPMSFGGASTEPCGEPDPLTASLNRGGFWCQRVLVCQRHCWWPAGGLPWPLSERKEDSGSIKRRTRSRLQFSLRFVLLAVTLTAILAFWLRPRYVNVEYELVEFTNMKDVVTGDAYVVARVRVTNRSPNRLWYLAISRESPRAIGTQQKLKDGWHHMGSGYATGDWRVFARNDSMVIDVGLHNEAKAFKVGLNFHTTRRGRSNTAWSGEFQVERPS